MSVHVFVCFLTVRCFVCYVFGELGELLTVSMMSLPMLEVSSTCTYV